MNLAKMRKFFSTLPWVFLLTVLIWAVTENLYTTTLGDQTLSVKITKAPQLVVEMVEPPDGMVKVDFRGPTASKQDLEEKIKAGLIFIPVSIPPNTEPGELLLSVRDLLMGVEGVVSEGMNVVTAEPESIRINVERLAIFKFQIKGDFRNVLVDGAPTFEPTMAEVEMPEFQYEAFADQIRVAATFDRPASLPEDGVVNEEVVLRLEKPDEVEVNANLLTRSTRLTVKVAALESKRTLNGIISVHESLPPGVRKLFIVEYKDEAELRINDLQVKGPTDLVSKINAEDVYAEIRIGVGDQGIQETWVQREVVFGLPQGVSTVETLPKVSFRLVPIEPPPNGNGL